MHLHDDTGCARGQRDRRRARRRQPGAGHDQRLRRAHRQLQPHARSSPTSAQDGHRARCPTGRLERLTPVSHHVAELVNLPLNPQAPYVGQSAFAHKAGLHVERDRQAARRLRARRPRLVGNGTRFVVCELAGRATIQIKAEELGLELDGPAAQPGARPAQAAGARGLPLRGGRRLARAAHAPGRPAGSRTDFELESFRVSVEHRPGAHGDLVENPLGHAEGIETECDDQGARCGGGRLLERIVATGEGNGPVNALDAAFRSAVGRPPTAGLGDMHLTDYKVRVLDTGARAPAAVTRVLIDSTDGDRTWTTIGVCENIIEASWQALVDSIVYGLLHVRAA